MKNKKLITTIIVAILIFSITLISCNNSETGGGETSALSPIDTTVTIPETADDTTTPEQTTVSPETTSTPETTILSEPNTTETPDVTETTPIEETTISETTTPKEQTSILANNATDISEMLTIHCATLVFSHTNAPNPPFGNIIKTKNEFDKIDWGALDLHATSDAYPLSINNILKKYDKRFFEEYYLLINCDMEASDKKTDGILYACFSNENILYISPNLKKFLDNPTPGEWHQWIYFIEIPKYLCDENTVSKIYPGGYCPVFWFEGTSYTLHAILEKPTTPIEKMCETEEFKKYLLICRNRFKQYYGSEDIEDILKIDELLKHCK